MSDMYSLIEKPRETRHFRYKLKLPLKSTNMGQNSGSCVGPKIWNNLTNACKLEENINTFKHKIKDTFFRNIQRADDDNIYIIKNRTGTFFFFFLICLQTQRGPLWKQGCISLLLSPAMSFGLCNNFYV